MWKTALLTLPLLNPTQPSSPVLASASALIKIGAKIEIKSEQLDLGFAYLTEWQKDRLVELNHNQGKCGGFEQLSNSESSILSANSLLQSLEAKVSREKEIANALLFHANHLLVEKNPKIETALQEMKSENIHSTVDWLSSFPSRYNRMSNPNVHVDAMEAKAREILSTYPGLFTVEQIAHRSTNQKTLRVHLEGKTRPSEVIVLGGHLDSINRSFGSQRAPGADDNASGSANLLEALRVLVQQGQPERSVEFFWYAGEESGLLGSSEIAQQYKSASKDVIAVLQLDMTMFPGSGEFVIGSMTDFTSAWLRNYLVTVNDLYLNAKIVESECGYGCSDHASWFRQGYATLMPFESDMESMNHNIHTSNDVINEETNFHHALTYGKIALIMAMDLGNSQLRQ